MCGLFAQFLSRPLQPSDVARGIACTAALAHRGPDGQKTWTDVQAGTFLGHRRLSIIDLSEASSQPFVADGVAVAFNGEIYNYRHLRDRLVAAGVRFRTNGDTEVLLQAWRVWGEQCLDEIEGMFAFVLWNGHEAFAAVDPFGEKPLYYAETPDGTRFSSELGPLVAAIGAVPRLAGEQLTAYLTTGCIPAPDTAYPMIRRAAPASVLRVRAGRVASVRKYWQIEMAGMAPGRPVPLTERDLDKVEEELSLSIDSRLVADVPVCAFLSSGVDSSLIVALARKHFDRRIPCITVAFSSGRAIDESPQAASIARYLDLPHEILESGRPQSQPVDAVLDIFGQPNDNVTVLAVAEMSERARSRYKVALTGMGGDELFFGYRKHAALYRLRHLLRVPGGVRSWVGGFADRLRYLHPKVGAFADIAGIRDWELVAAQKNVGTIRWLRQVAGWRHWAQTHFDTAHLPLDRIAPYYDLTHTMPDLLLPAQDLGSMRHGLELRTPFLSRRLWSVVAGYDPRALLAFGRKSVLRRILARHLPAALMDSRKVGFIYPMDNFLRDRATAPSLQGLDARLSGMVWGRRTQGDAWLRLSVRLALAEAFLSRPARAAN